MNFDLPNIVNLVGKWPMTDCYFVLWYRESLCGKMLLMMTSDSEHNKYTVARVEDECSGTSDIK